MSTNPDGFSSAQPSGSAQSLRTAVIAITFVVSLMAGVGGLAREAKAAAVTNADRYRTVDAFTKVEAAKPTPAELRALSGTYVSDESETTLIAAVEDGSLVLKRRPDTTIRLTPLYKDAFSGSIGTVIFRRNNSGRVAELSVSQDRVWDMRFARRDAPASTAQ